MPESTLGVGCSCYYGNMCDVADTSESFATETIRCQGNEVVKRTYLAGGESLADNFHVFLLRQQNTAMQILIGFFVIYNYHLCPELLWSPIYKDSYDISS